jgi:hypothetical protein
MQPVKPESERLIVKRSKLPGAGMGLFAKTDFKKGERITEYKGRLCWWREVKHQDGANTYLMRVSRTRAIDAQPMINTFGRYANDARGARRVAGIRNNSEYVSDGNRCFIEAKRAIGKGEEILVGYGREFWVLQKKLQRLCAK